MTLPTSASPTSANSAPEASLLAEGEAGRGQAVGLPQRPWLLAVVGLVLLHLAHPGSFGAAGPTLWPPHLGLGLVLTFWLGPWGAGLAGADVLLVRLLGGTEAGSLPAPLLQAGLTAGELLLGWWWYVRLCAGAPRLNDPTAATVFLLLVPGAAIGLGALGQVLLSDPANGAETFTRLWVTHSLSVLVLAPPLLLVLTPWLKQAGLAPAATEGPSEELWPETWSVGEAVEVGGLALGAGILGMLLTARHAAHASGDWLLWGILLLVTVWAGLRQGLRGSAPASMAAAVAALLTAAFRPELAERPLLPLQGNLLALASTALLVGASTGWIRANETRYRQVVGHIPVVLYSARLLRLPAAAVAPLARVTLVGPASRQVFGVAPDRLLGDYERWLGLVRPEDREVVMAALAQLCRQNQPVTCEYRLIGPATAAATLSPRTALPEERWVRDTLAPRYDEAGHLQGWDGVVEDITERRLLSFNLRRTSSMLQALVANLPAGVVFVQGDPGRPILVNARARQLLGQREDLSADITHLPLVYRLHRPDGTLYPWEDLPVARALRQGTTSMRDDIVVHRSDCRRIPLVAWGAPVNLEEGDRPDAAVWVFEDLTALRQAEAAHQQSEARLRAIIETMAEGLIVQDESGAVVEWNPAACVILGTSPEGMAGRSALGPDEGCLREDSSPCPRAEQPDGVCLRTRAPVRNVVLGIPLAATPPVRWILANAMPLLQPGTAGVASYRVVTTFADITAYRQLKQDLGRVQRLDLMGRLASGIVHDFNNLLGVALGLTFQAREQLSSDHPATQDLSRLQEAIEQAGRLAGQLLTFSKQRRVELRPVPLDGVVRRTLDLLRSSLPPAVVVVPLLGAGGAEVLADEGQVQQVLMNLCLNARDAMPAGGQLTVRTVRQEAGPAPPAQSHGGAVRPWVLLSVQDTGSGMEGAVLDRIFDPFYTTKERGTGLGLAVARQLVEGFSGRIEVWTEVGQGTRFDVWFLEYEPEGRLDK